MSATQRHRDGTGWEQAAGYSRAVRHGNHIMVSGTTATGDDNVVVGAETYQQTRVALERALDAVSELGGSREDIARTRVFLTPDADWIEAARAHEEMLGDLAPANTTLFVNSLVGEGFLVEVEVEAVIVP